jgi:membrane protein required for colicin V production
LNPFDITIVVIICFCVIRGAFRGIIKEASSIVGVIAGLYLALTYYPAFSGIVVKIVDIFPSPGYLNIFSFLIIFGIIFFCISALGILLKYLLKIVFLSWLDKLCGAFFGFVKGFMIVSVLMLPLTAFLDKGTPIINESLLCPYVSSISENMSRFASKDLRRQFNAKIEVARKSWDQRNKK